MNVLGVSFDYHDAAAALICDGEVVCAIQEERLSRIKHDEVIPIRAIEECLKRGGIFACELDAVVHYENPIKKFDRISSSAFKTIPFATRNFSKALNSWISAEKFDPRKRLAKYLDLGEEKIHYCEHHLSHAASAFFCSPFDEATVVTIDGVGEYETAVSFKASTDGIKRVKSTRFPHSLGLFYSAFTAYLGFEVNEGEYKVMGMAAFGHPEYYNEIRDMIECKHGLIRVDQSYFTFRNPDVMPFNEKLIRVLGPPRTPETFIDLDSLHTGKSHDADSLRFANIAASIQKVTEEVILEYSDNAIKTTGIPRLCLAGGVALNSLANGRLQADLGIPLYIHMSPGDSGGAIGAALNYYNQKAVKKSTKPLRTPYLGLSYSESEILWSARNYDSSEVTRFESEAQMIDVVASYLAAGKVVGWLQGRFEWGPRALGARSILASPTFADMKERVNAKIKFREAFRPFAPSVLAEEADKYFMLPQTDIDPRPEDYMLSVCPVKEEFRDKIPAVVHVDGTARVQTVRPDLNLKYYSLIKKVGELTGVPILLNTSFNLKGEPIVSTPSNAIQTFEWSEMDHLVMENIVLNRPKTKDLLRSALTSNQRTTSMSLINE